MKACLQLQPDVLLQRLPAYYKTLGLFINLHKEMAFMDNLIFAEIKSFSALFCIGSLKLLDFNELHLLFDITDL